jgi:hypothetical protein
MNTHKHMDKALDSAFRFSHLFSLSEIHSMKIAWCRWYMWDELW